MSADDFQTKYCSVMESMLKSAVAETTKLFENMVDELKAEISQMKKENEDLKTRCSLFEKERNQSTVHTRESEPLPGPSNCSEKCDRAVQCDLAPVRTVLVEQCQPLRHSSLHNQEQRCAHEEIDYSLQDHTYGEGTTRMGLTLVKQEDLDDDCSEQSVLKQEEEGSPQACASGTENEGPGETGEMPLTQKEQESQQALELPCLEIDSSLQGPLNLSSDLEPSLGISLAATKDNIGDTSEVYRKTEQELIPEKHLLVVAQHQSEVEPQQCQIEGKMSINEQAHVSQQRCADVQSTEQQLAKHTPLKGEAAENLKSSVVDGGASPQTELVVKRRRRQPPKKAKHPQQRVKETVSQRLSMQIEEGPIQAPSSEGSSAMGTQNTQPVEPRERCTSATLQDAMLLVEAMNQSTADSTFSPPKTLVQCSPRVGILETVTEVPAETEISLPPVETCKAAGNLPVTELSTATQPSTEQLSAASVTNEAQAHIKSVTSKQHVVAPSNTSTPSLALSTVAVQTHVHSLQQRPRITLVAPSKHVVSHKIMSMPTPVSTLMHHKVAALSTSKLPTLVSTVVANAQKNSVQPSLSSVPLKTMYIISRKSLPVVPSQLSTPSTDLLSETLPQPKITIIIPKRVKAVASRSPQPQTTVVTTEQESAKSTAPVTLSSQQVLNVFVDTRTVLDEVATIQSSQEGKPSDNVESPKQTTSVSEPMNAPPDVCSSLNKSVDLVPASESLVTFEQNLSAVVRLTRLPFPVSAKEAVFVARLSTDGFSEKQSTLKDGCVHRATDDGFSCVVPSETLVSSTDISPTLKEASFVNTCQMSEEQNSNGEKTSLAPENCTILEEESPDSGPSSKVAAAVFEKSPSAINTNGPPAVSGTVGEATSNSEDKLSTVTVQDSSPTDPPIEEKQSAALVHQTSITTKDTSDPHLQLTKAQFLAKLAVTPVIEDPVKASSDGSVTAAASCAETSASDKERLRRNSVLSHLQSHLKAHLKARTTGTNPEPHTKTKKRRSEKDVPNDKNTTREPILFSLKDLGAVEDVISPKLTANDRTPVGPRRPGLCEAGVGPKKTRSTRRSDSMQQKASPEKTKSTAVSPRMSCKGKTNPPLVRQRRSSSVKESASAKKTKSTSVSSRRSSSTKQSGSPKETRKVSIQPRRISSARDGTSPKIGASPKSTKASSVSPNKTKSMRDSLCPKKTRSAYSPRASSLSENATTPKVTTNESFCRRRCTFPKDIPSSKQVQSDVSSSSPGGNITSDTKNSGVRWPKLSKDEVSRRKTRESPPSKKPRLSEEGASPKKNLGLGAKKLAKANTMDKMKNSCQSKLQNGAKTSQLVENHASYEAVKKCTAKAVWTPPRMSASQTPPVGGTKETSSPASQGLPLVYPPSVSLLPIPVKAPPVVSPLQPLSVIGRRLLKNQCGECGRVLSSVAALESHVSLHAGHRPFSCTLCGKRFPDSKGLKRHGRVHRNGRIHNCPQCGKGFVYRFGLSKHLRMVHRRIKPFICQICNKGFFTKRDVEAHIRMHTGEKPFHCNLCEKKFARRVELNVHLRWHNGEKRHWCPFCGKGFLDLNNLKRHKYIHTGEKPHSCPHCPKKFTQSGHLKKHVKNVHKILDP